MESSIALVHDNSYIASGTTAYIKIFYACGLIQIGKKLLLDYLNSPIYSRNFVCWHLFFTKENRKGCLWKQTTHTKNENQRLSLIKSLHIQHCSLQGFISRYHRLKLYSIFKVIGSMIPKKTPKKTIIYTMISYMESK